MFYQKWLVLLITTLTITSKIVVAMDNWDDLLNDDAYDTSHWVNPNDMGSEPRPLKVTVLKKPVVDIKSPPSNLEVNGKTISNQDVTPLTSNPSKFYLLKDC